MQPITIALLLLIHCSASNLDLASQSLVQLDSIVQNESHPCTFHLSMASKRAHYDYQCQTTRTSGIFNVTELIGQEDHDTHRFLLFSPSSAYPIGNVTCSTTYGINWNYSITLMTQETSINIAGTALYNEYAPVYIALGYSVLAGLVLPLKQEYYLYMSSVSVFSWVVSLFVSLSVVVNLVTVIYKYLVLTIANFSSQAAVHIIMVALCLLLSVTHLSNKNRMFLHKLHHTYYSSTFRLCMGSLSYGILAIALLAYLRVHKDVSTYVGFASGLVYYMIGFLLYKDMRIQKVYFSFRLVVFDSLSILLLVLFSKFYPILHYQIPSLYMLVGALLLVAILLIYGSITYILVNIIKRDSQLHQESKAPTQHKLGKEQTEHIVMCEEQLNQRQIELGQNGNCNGEKDENWRKLTQESMATHTVGNNSQIDQENRNSGRVQI